MNAEVLEEIKLFKTSDRLIAYDGEQYYEIVPCKYVSTDKEKFPKNGFAFKPIKRWIEIQEV